MIDWSKAKPDKSIIMEIIREQKYIQLKDQLHKRYRGMSEEMLGSLK